MQRKEFILTCGNMKYKLQMGASMIVTYETLFRSLAFASWLSGCYPPDSKQILWLLYYTPRKRNNTEEALLSVPTTANDFYVSIQYEVLIGKCMCQ